MSMTGLGASLKYGAKLFGYFFLIIVFGGAGVSLGAVLAGPEVQSLLAGGTPDILALSGGLLVIGLGAALVLVGTFSITYKLISDAVSTGINDGVETLGVSVTEFSDELEGVTLRDVTVKGSATEAVLESELNGDDSTGTSTTDDDGAVAAPTPEAGTNPPDEDGPTETIDTQTDAPQPEQSAEEIVFGSASQQAGETEEAPVQEAEPTTGTDAAVAEPAVDEAESTPQVSEEVARTDETETQATDQPITREESPKPAESSKEVADAGQPVSESSTDIDETGVGQLDIEEEQEEEVPAFDELDEGESEIAEDAEGSWDDDPLAD